MATYLYGDSQPFEGGYDFLAELRGFVHAASEALVLAHEADALEESLGERAQEHLHAIEALQTFFDNVYRGVADRAARSAAPALVAPYAQDLLAQIESMGQRAKQSRAHHLDADSVKVTSSIHQKRSDLRDVLATYLLGDPIPTLSWAMSLNLGGTAPHGQIVLSHPDELTTSFSVDVNESAWGKARKVSELCPGLSLQVGFKKAFLRSSLQPDVHALDDYYLGDLEIGPDSMDVHLRRKPDAPRDSYVLELDVDETGVTVARVVTRNVKKGGESEPFTSQGEDLEKIEALGEILRRECAPLLRRKRRLVFAHLDGHDVFERGLVRQLFERVVARMAPVARRVAAHSPNPSELSLKVERDGGRREEIYLRKQDLIDMVAPLPDEERALFAPLEFLPTRKTSAPPPPPNRKW
ncbi:MAG: hypothetical protein H6719_35910 [Sandaracinaceae bacterium]|nr:hypothetical protein [Sandaracinaceae bacterium]